VLFGLHPVLNVRPQARMRAMQDNVGDLWYFGSGSPTYDVFSAAEAPSAKDLRSAPPPALVAERFYRQLPPMSRRVRALADSLTAGSATQYDKVIAVQNYLRSQFSYTLELPASAREATLENFLFHRRAGHCEYFSTALAVLLREVGIPTRNVNGFLGGTWNEFGRFLTVTQNEAHSWVEVYFSGYGWVAFDATPAAAAGVARQQSTWFAPLRTMLDGLEHRWNKWILEYDLDAQVNLFRRATETFTRRDSTGELKMNPGLVQAFKWLMMAAGVCFVLLLIFQRARFEDVGAEARVYLKLRRAYDKAGYDVRAHDGPLLFLDRLTRAGAPGRDQARTAIELYVRSRFGGEDIGQSGKQELRDAARAAQRSLRSARNRRAGPSSSETSVSSRARAS
jgi:hypothetical protein